MANMGRSDLEILQNNQADMVKSIKDIKQFVQYMKTNEKSKIQDSNVTARPIPLCSNSRAYTNTFFLLTHRRCRRQYET